MNSASCAHAQLYASLPSNAGPAEPALPSSVLTGYLFCHGKAFDLYTTAQIQEVLQNLKINMEGPPPFKTVTEDAGYASHGVVKINNIPYTVTGQEITQFISRYSRTPMLAAHNQGWGLHIIMEKPTGKTMDCFVEFPNHQAARDCVKQFDFTATPGRATKIGNRNVSLDMSNQGELMKALFPRARFVHFDDITGRPTIMGHETDASWSIGFRGYFTLEELYGVARFSETPSRSPFVLKSNQRVYESMISTLYKFPWAATQTYTVAARDALFDVALKQLDTLGKKVDPDIHFNSTAVVPYNPNQDYGRGYNSPYSRRPSDSSPSSYRSESSPFQQEVGLSQKLLTDLLLAAVNVKAFSPAQKYELCQIAGRFGRGVPLDPTAQFWPFQTMAAKLDQPDNVVQFWLQIFDSGYDLIETEGTETTFEHYIKFARNDTGFPVAVFTQAGLELPFEDAIRIEMAATMVYIVRGREAWAAERNMKVSEWKVDKLMDLMQTVAMEKEAGRHFERGEPKLHTRQDNILSPGATEYIQRSFSAVDSIRNIALAGSSPNSSFDSGNMRTQAAASKFNPATAKDFVPASARKQSWFEPATVRKDSCTQPATNNVYGAFQSIWSDPPVGVAQPSRANLLSTIREKEEGPVTTRDEVSQDMRTNTRTTTAFRNPFDPPSHETQGFKPTEDDPRLHRSIPPNERSQSIFNPFERRLSVAHPNSSATTTNDLSTFKDRHYSISTAAATTRNNSADTALISTSTSNDLTRATTTGASSSRNSSFAVGEAGSPTLKRVQKYPNLTYSSDASRRASIGQGLEPKLAFRQMEIESRAHAVALRSVPLARTLGPSPFEKTRALSTPFTPTRYSQSSGSVPGPIGSEKRDSLPVNVNGGTIDSVASDLAATQIQTQTPARAHGGTMVENDNDEDTNAKFGRESGAGRLTATELWKSFRGY